MASIYKKPIEKRTIYIHNEQSARASALIKHISKFNPEYLIKSITQNNIPQNILEDDYLFILNENAIKEYSTQYSPLFNPDNLVYPQNESINLECSKSFCRQYINSIGLGNINPDYKILTTTTPLNILATLDYTNKVIKADGLESGKGVFVQGDHYKTNNDAYYIIYKLLKKHSTILLEEKLIGEEFSLISLSWKGHITHFPLIKDFKRLCNNDTGANTGGMGTISFAGGLMPFISADEYTHCCSINEKVIRDSGFVGFLYGSFMKTLSGDIKLIEYNVRLGDSEAVNLLGLLESSLIDYLDNPIGKSLQININKYTYFRYLVPSTYPSNSSSSNNGDSKYFVVNSAIPKETHFYTANCFEKNLDGVYQMGKSRTCGIFTIDVEIDKVIYWNDYYVKMIYGDFHYRTDIGTYFSKEYKNKHKNKFLPSTRINYLNHLNNYNHIITNTKEVIDTVNKDIELASDGKIKVIGKIGDFANSIQYNGSKLICSVDGAGTKTKFLEDHPERFHILGQDIVIHNINDMYCNNGTPIALLDYYGCDKLDKQQFNQFIAGALEICKEYSIPMIGGETAEMRGIFTDGEVEVLGILLGVVNETPENGIGIQKGNYIYGIESSGAHTNGFTKLREIATLVNGGMPEWVKSFFSQPHKCYVKIMDCIKAILADSGINIVGKSHITGGGFVDNIERILPGVVVDGVDGMHIELGRWDLNKEWQWVYDNAGMEWDAFIRVFNAGWGFCFITDKEISIDVIDTFKIKEKIKLIGNII